MSRRTRMLLLPLALLPGFALAVRAAPADAPAPLIAQYHLDANDGADSSGNGINGTPGNGATVVTGKFHGALQAGGGASLTVPGNSPKIGLLEPEHTTLLLWFKQNGDPGKLKYLASAGGQGPGTCGGSPFAIYTGYNGYPGGPGVVFYVKGVSADHISPGTGLQVFDNQWHMIAGTFDGTYTRMYLDGNLVGNPAAEPDQINYSIATDKSFQVAQYSAAGCGISVFPGAIDEVRMYSRALSATEIGRMAAAAGPDPPDLVPDSTATTPTPTETTPPPPPPDPLPAKGVDFTWSPNKPALVAGVPVGGVQFSAPALNGATYQWDFDYNPAAGFRPIAGGSAPRHGFTADGAHDTKAFTDADGQRRRLYTVRLRVTDGNGAVAEATHDLVVVPDNPPQVDFLTDRPDQVASHDVTFTPEVSDPDATERTADAIDHVEWDFDGTLGDPAGADLICNAKGNGCHGPDGGAPGGWLTQTPSGQIKVNFYNRELASHHLLPLGATDVNALPLNGSAATNGSIAVRFYDRVHYFIRDPRVAFLYDNATMLQQSSFDSDAGEATGASLQQGGLRRRPVRARRRVSARAAVSPVVVKSQELRWRQVTLTAVDGAGQRESVTHALPLVPDTPPKLNADFVVEGAGNSRAAGRTHLATAKTAALSQKVIPFPLTTSSRLAYDASGTADPDGKVAYYTLEVGIPLHGLGDCIPTPKAPQYQPPSTFERPPLDQIDPYLVFPTISDIGSGSQFPIGKAGNLDLTKLKTTPGFFTARATTPLPTLTSLLANRPYVHPCGPYEQRNVDQTRNVEHSPIDPVRFVQLTPSGPRTVSAIVTSNPADLRFQFLNPTDPGQTDEQLLANPAPDTYSVTVAAYDNSGLGAIQRTDGFKVLDGRNRRCRVVNGLPVQVNLGTQGHPNRRLFGLSSQCADITPQLSGFYTKGDVSLNGVTIRPDEGAGIVVDRDRGIWVTKNDEPTGIFALDDDAQAYAKLRSIEGTGLAGASLIVDGERIAHWSRIGSAEFQSLLQGPVKGTYYGQPVLVDGASYHGSPIERWAAGQRSSTALHIDFGTDEGDEGKSHTHFKVLLPKAFSSTLDPANRSPAAPVDRYGVEELSKTELGTNTFADIARHKRQRAPLRARTAQKSGDVTTINLDNTALGPVTIEKGLMRFDPGRGLFEGNIEKATLNIGDASPSASLHILIDGGELRSASGAVDGRVPVFTGIDLTEVRFSIVTDPLTLKGGASFTAGDAVKGDLDLLLRPDPFLIRLDGEVEVGDFLKLGGAYVQYDASNHHNVTFGGRLGVDLGPVAARGLVDGGFSAETRDFFLQGAVRVCVGVCASGKVLLSKEALAACAEVDLGVDTVGAGFAFHFPGLELFSGCDLNRFRPAVFRTRSGPTLDARAAANDGIIVPEGTEEAAFRFRGGAGAAASPVVSIVSPDGRRYSTAPGSGDYIFSSPAATSPAGGSGVTKSGSALIDRDPVDKVTTFLVAKPSAGSWKVVLGPGQPALAGIDVATGEHVEASDIGGSVVDADPTSDGARIGDKAFSARAAVAAAASGSRIRALRDETNPARIEDSRMRGIVLKVPSGLDGTMTVVDSGPTTNQVITRIDLDRNGGKQVPIAFTPAADAGPHEVKGVLEHADGTPRSVLSIDAYTASPIPSPKAPSLSATELGRRRLAVTFGTRRTALLSDPAARLDLLVVTPSGDRIERVVDSGDAKRLSAGRYRIVLDGVNTAGKVQVASRIVYAGKLGAVAKTVASP